MDVHIWFDYTFSKEFFHKSSKYKYIINKSPKNKYSLYISCEIDRLIKYIPKKYHSAIITCNSKDQFIAYMHSISLGKYIPNTYYNEPTIFPCIMKPIIGVAGTDTFLFVTKEEYDSGSIKYNSRFMIQDYILSNVFNVAHILCNNGNIVYSVVYSEKTQPYVIKRGKLINYTKRCLSDEEIKIFGLIMTGLCYHGVCSVDFVYDSGGNMKIFEINPRFGGSMFFDKDDFEIFVDKTIEHHIMF